MNAPNPSTVSQPPRVRLTFDERCKSRLLLRLDSGEQAALIVERGRVLRHGEHVPLADGRDVEIVAADEALLEAVSPDPLVIAKAAYHLGNRHVAVQLKADRLRCAADHVLESMVAGLGLSVTRIVAPFEPEGGAYGHRHAHAGEARASAARIHSYASTPNPRPASLAQMRLLQIASQAFPIGGYSHSHGLEAAVDGGLVCDEPSLRQWITDMLTFSIGSYEAPCLHDMASAWSARDGAALRELNARFLATRETAELRAATLQMGYSMRALLVTLPGLPADFLGLLGSVDEPSLPCVWSGAASAWSIDPLDSLAAYLWCWAENQVLVAVKSIPLGQSAGQRVLLDVAERIALCVDRWQPIAEERRSNFAPGLAILSARHETQYSRLFRS